MLYKAYPDPDQTLKKANFGPLEKVEPIPKFTVWGRHSYLTNQGSWFNIWQ